MGRSSGKSICKRGNTRIRCIRGTNKKTQGTMGARKGRRRERKASRKRSMGCFLTLKIMNDKLVVIIIIL